MILRKFSTGLEDTWRSMLDEGVLCDDWKDYGTFESWVLDQGPYLPSTFRRIDPTKILSPDNTVMVQIAYNHGRDDDFIPYGNPAYELYRELDELLGRVVNIRLYKDDRECDIDVKDTVIGRIIPTGRGFDIYMTTECSYEDKDILEDVEGDVVDDLGYVMRCDGHVRVESVFPNIVDAYDWADELISDDEWYESG